jgi:hypothetical protein
MREIAKDDREDFSRWLAHKTSGIKDGKTRNIFIHCGIKVYQFEAVGYMQETLLKKQN